MTHDYGPPDARVRALANVALEIAAGGYVAVTGPSGAGKSTLLGLIGGLEHPQLGDLTIDGHDLTRLTGDGLARYRRTTVGFVFQHFGLLDLLSAEENIELALSLAGLDPNRRSERAGELLESVGLADEPTGNLDTKTAMVVLDVLERVHRERGCTLVVVTHNPLVAQRADRRLAMDSGRIVT